MTNTAKTLLALPILLVAIIVGACSGAATPDQAIQTAEAAIRTHDYTNARNALVPVIESLDKANPSVSNLAKMAVIMMRVSDNDNQNGNDAAMALTCFQRALDTDPDSLRILISSLDPDDAQYLFMLWNLDNGIRSDQSELMVDEDAAHDDEYSDDDTTHTLD